ncbi:MAG: hypothetical protein JWN02_2135 [Acidobacteria bacterium]|nr:hypothetical protein [Acidobacteriota bacterium]
MRALTRLIAPLALVVAAGCATSKTVNMDEPRRLVGTENQVRLDAEVYADTLAPAQTLTFKYEITNNRSTPIAVADLIPETSYDPETQVVTLTIGSEVPGTQLLPRLLVINSGEKKSFATTAHVNIGVSPMRTPWTRFPNALQLKLNFLGETKPFEMLIGIPERAVANAKLADELFPQWTERNEVLYANPLAMRWAGASDDTGAADTTNPRTRRRGGP